jgi:hypothetical protein
MTSREEDFQWPAAQQPNMKANLKDEKRASNSFQNQHETITLIPTMILMTRTQTQIAQWYPVNDVRKRICWLRRFAVLWNRDPADHPMKRFPWLFNDTIASLFLRTNRWSVPADALVDLSNQVEHLIQVRDLTFEGRSNQKNQTADKKSPVRSFPIYCGNHCDLLTFVILGFGSSSSLWRSI